MEFSRFRDILSPVLLATASRYVNLSKNITVYPIVAAKWSSRGVKTKLAMALVSSMSICEVWWYLQFA